MVYKLRDIRVQENILVDTRNHTGGIWRHRKNERNQCISDKYKQINQYQLDTGAVSSAKSHSYVIPDTSHVLSYVHYHLRKFWP